MLMSFSKMFSFKYIMFFAHMDPPPHSLCLLPYFSPEGPVSTCMNFCIKCFVIFLLFHIWTLNRTVTLSESNFGVDEITQWLKALVTKSEFSPQEPPPCGRQELTPMS